MVASKKLQNVLLALSDFPRAPGKAAARNARTAIDCRSIRTQDISLDARFCLLISAWTMRPPPARSANRLVHPALERRGSQILFNPRLLELSAHYQDVADMRAGSRGCQPRTFDRRYLWDARAEPLRRQFLEQ